MDDATVMTEFRNIQHRVWEVEQILPTLATKELVTATGEDLRGEIAESRRHAEQLAADSRRYTDERTHRLEVLVESVRDDVRLIAEAQVAGFDRHDRMWEDVRRVIVGIDLRVTRLEARVPPEAAP